MNHESGCGCLASATPSISNEENRILDKKITDNFKQNWYKSGLKVVNRPLKVRNLSSESGGRADRSLTEYSDYASLCNEGIETSVLAIRKRNGITP